MKTSSVLLFLLFLIALPTVSNQLTGTSYAQTEEATSEDPRQFNDEDQLVDPNSPFEVPKKTFGMFYWGVGIGLGILIIAMIY